VVTLWALQGGYVIEAYCFGKLAASCLATFNVTFMLG
jgi:hypothetical protein